MGLFIWTGEPYNAECLQRSSGLMSTCVNKKLLQLLKRGYNVPSGCSLLGFTGGHKPDNEENRAMLKMQIYGSSIFNAFDLSLQTPRSAEKGLQFDPGY